MYFVPKLTSLRFSLHAKVVPTPFAFSPTSRSTPLLTMMWRVSVNFCHSSAFQTTSRTLLSSGWRMPCLWMTFQIDTLFFVKAVYSAGIFETFVILRGFITS